MTSAERRRLVEILEEAFTEVADAGMPYDADDFLDGVAGRIEALFQEIPGADNDQY